MCVCVFDVVVGEGRRVRISNIFSFLMSPPLHFLRNSLARNGIGDAGAASLADALKQNSTVTTFM